jgi:hypothetical protein
VTTTVFIHVITLTSEHILVGNKGGQSSVVGVVAENHPTLGVVVETEHGIICYARNDFVEVLLNG